VLQKLPFDRPFVWRYAKSVFKRSVLRRDPVMFGWISQRIEVRARRSGGTTSTLKSGRDGQKRETPVFRRQTQNWTRRAAWRHLRQLAKHWPELYSAAAAEALVHYSPQNAEQASGFYGQLSHCYLLNRVVYGESKRLELEDRKLRFKFRGSHLTQPKQGVREEPYPELWDDQPTPFLRLLADARLPEVQEFAAFAVRTRHPDVMADATSRQLVSMLGAGHPDVVALAIGELGGRFDPASPDWALLEMLIIHEDDSVRGVGLNWLREAASLWTTDLERTLFFLRAPFGDVRNLAADLAAEALLAGDASLRVALAARILDLLRGPEEPAGSHAALAFVAGNALLAELGELLTMEELVTLIETGSSSAKTVAGALLGRVPDALAWLGLPRILSFAENQVRAVRAAAQSIIVSAAEHLIRDPGLLFLLVESQWPDTRQAAFEILDAHGALATLGLDGIVGLCDSNRRDVQAMGRTLLLRHLAEIEEPGIVLQRLSEHPDSAMHELVLDLAADHLDAGQHPLAGLERFFNTVLFSLWPSRAHKRRVVDMLVERGCEDTDQAAVAIRVLGVFVRTKGVADFEQALAALTRLRLRFPDVASSLEVIG
jgi:hypothetical protein